MIKFFIIAALIFVALVFGHELIDYQGQVIITTETHVLELRLVSALILLALAGFVLWVLTVISVKLVRLFLGSKNWLGGLSSRQKKTAFFDAIALMSSKQPEKAKARLSKALGGDFQGADYLMMAQLETDTAQRQKWLAQVEGNAQLEISATIALAESYLPNDPAFALTVLEEISEKHQKDVAVISSKIMVLAALENWKSVKELLQEHKRKLPDDFFEHWTKRTVTGEFASIASKQGAKTLIQHWQSQPRNIQRSLENQSAFVNQLLEQGLHQDAEEYLLKFSKKDAQDKLLPLFNRLSLKSPTASIRYIENKIKLAPHKAIYYSILASLAFNADDLALAQKAVNKAISIDNNRDDLLLLAKIHEQRHDQASANAVYKNIVGLIASK